METVTREVQANDWKEVVSELAPDGPGRGVDRACPSVCLPRDVCRESDSAEEPGWSRENTEVRGRGGGSGRAPGGEAGAEVE